MKINAFNLWAGFTIVVLCFVVAQLGIFLADKINKTEVQHKMACENLRKRQLKYEQSEDYLAAVMMIDTQYNQGCEVDIN